MTNISEIRYWVYCYLHALWRRRYIIFIALICAPFLGLLLSAQAPKKYEASTSLATFNITPSFLKDIATVSDLEQQVSGLKAFITSPSSLKKVALNVGLISPTDSEERIQGVVTKLSKEITVTSTEKNLVEIKVTSGDSKNVIPILSNLNKMFMTEFLRPIIMSARASTVLLEKQYQEQEIKLNKAVENLNKFKRDNSKILPEYQSIYMSQLRDIMRAINKNETEYKVAISEEKLIKNSVSNSNPEIANLDRAITENDKNISKMADIYTEDYSGIVAAKKLAKGLRTERDKLYKKLVLANKNKTITASNENNQEIQIQQFNSSNQYNNYISVKKQINGLSLQLKDLNTQKNYLINLLKKIDEVQNRMDFLAKSVADNQHTYETIFNQYNLAKLFSQLDYTNKFSPIKIVAFPQEPLINTGKPASFFIIIAILGSLIFGIVLVFTLDFLDSLARKRKTLELATGISVITRIGNLTAK